MVVCINEVKKTKFYAIKKKKKEDTTTTWGFVNFMLSNFKGGNIHNIQKYHFKYNLLPYKKEKRKKRKERKITFPQVQ